MPNERSPEEQTLRELSLRQAIAEQNSKILRDLMGKIGTRQRRRVSDRSPRSFEVFLGRQP
jgi:hypothetical protein